MREAIQTIIDAIEPGYVFDSHFVIRKLLETPEFADRYSRAANNSNYQTEAAFHGHIAQIIRDEINGVNRMGTHENGNIQSWSYNKNNTPSECACWLRV